MEVELLRTISLWRIPKSYEFWI